MTLDWLARTKVMAEMAPRDETGRPQCFACGAKDELCLIAPGWGGVWECRTCVQLGEEEARMAGPAVDGGSQ